jgi:DNA-binding MarR family transcriptional regulator
MMADGNLSQDEYAKLARHRNRLRRQLAFGERAAVELGLPPTEYQALVVIKGAEFAPTIGDLANELLTKHNSAVGLVDRLELARLVQRRQDRRDRRVVRLLITRKGGRLLAKLAETHRSELRSFNLV